VDRDRLYLDYNATSPLSHSVQDWLRSGEVLFANPASQHSDGKASRKLINESRAFIYETFGLREKDYKLFFHSGATEAFHTFTYSFSEMARLNGKELLVCYSRIDHPAVMSLSEKYFGPHVKFYELKRGSNLHYDHAENLNFLRDKKDNNPDLLILYHHLWVHNETGQISSLDELSEIRKIPDLYVHVDGVQAPGKIPRWNVLKGGDVWSFSAHKFGALKGIGFSFFRSDLFFHPFITGGSQQSNLRSGTENVQGVKSIALALKDLRRVNVEENSQRRKKLVEFVKTGLKDLGEVLDDKDMASNTIYFYLHHFPSDIALALFDLHGLEISAGSACSSGTAKPSAVLVQKGLKDTAKNGLRLSMAFENSEEDLNEIMVRLDRVFNKLRQNSPS
jgi:cysteine desulfurase